MTSSLYENAAVDTRRLKLEAKVRAVNKANAEANRIWDLLAPVFLPLVGEKVLKANGELLTKIKVPELPNRGDLRVTRQTGAYSLAFDVYVSEDTKLNHHLSHVTTAYIGSLSNGVLNNISDRNIRRTDYTADEIAGLRAEHAAIVRNAEIVKAKFNDFGESERG